MKNNLKKRIISFALALSMMVSMLPTTALTAFAEEIPSEILTVEEVQTSPSPSPVVEDEEDTELTATQGDTAEKAFEENSDEISEITEDKEINTAPQLNADAPQVVELKVGDSYDVTQHFADADGDVLKFTVSCDDENVATEVESYKFSSAQTGSFAVSVQANDGKAASQWYNVAIVVNEAVSEETSATEKTAEDIEKALNNNIAILSDDIATVAETECSVTDNVIDITDRQLYKRTNAMYINAINITVTGGTVKSATEDGTTINILMDCTTDPSAELRITFGTSGKKCSAKQNINTVTLAEGTASATITVTGYYYNDRFSGSVTYTININSEAAGTAEIESVTVGRKDGGTDYTVKETKTLELSAAVSPTDAKSRKVVWESLDESVATVDEKGVVTGVKTGTVKIRATSDVDETKYGEVEVTVLPVPDNVLLLDIATSNGSIDSVEFLDANGAVLDVAKKPTLEDNVMKVVLSKSVAKNATVTAKFSRTANGSDLPFLTPNNAFNRAYTSRTDTYKTILSDGKGTATIYLYNSSPGATSNSYTTYTISYEMENNLPVLAGKTADEAIISANTEYKINLAGLFNDADGEALTYKYSADGTNYTVFEGEEYTFTQSIPGEYKLYFKANDGLADSEDIYTVTVNVTNSTVKYTANVKVPQDVTPSFYITKEFDSDKTDVLGEVLTAEKGTTENGFTQYTVAIPENITRISVRDENWGGMTFATKDSDGEIITAVHIFTKVTPEIIDMTGTETDGTVTVSYGEYKAAKGTNGYLLYTGIEYTYTAVPSDTSSYTTGTNTETLATDAESYTAMVEVPLNNPFTIKAPTGAKAQLYKYNKYYDNTEYESFAVRDNGDGTSTTYFAGVSSSVGSTLIYRVKYNDYAVKAGWTTKSVTVTFNENDLKEDARIDYKTSTDSNASMSEDNVLLNINGQNNLVMSIGDTKTLKAYRAWEIIPVSYNNWIVTPDFNYNIISGSDVVALTDKASRSTSDTDWKTITALKEGTAVIEVSYDAIDVRGGSSWNGTYGATDPARTGLVVVQVGGHADVDFGIECLTSQGSLEYNKNNQKAWDAEFDTLYFTGEKGELKLSPTADGVVQKVQVSADKGISWTTLTEKDGVYTAPIAHGNNIIRVITDKGEAYQVVRGYKVGVTYKIIDDNGNGVVDAGETVRITFDQIHQPIPKMAGNYNPGYRGNTDGNSNTHIRYTFIDKTITGGMTQYEVPTAANYIDVTIPADTTQTSFTLSNGYIATGVIGLTEFANGGDSHRNIPDSGCTTRDSKTTFNTRSMLPDITINIGDQSAPNSAPYAKGDAVAQAQIELGQTYAINPETLFADADNDALTFTYSVNGTDKGSTDKSFKFTPDTKGEYKLVFTANDGKLTAQHTLILKVVAATQKDTTIKFDIDKSDIKGYVTVGFEDKGVRDENAYGLKYPVALGTIIEETRVPFAEGDTIAEVTIRLLDAMNIGYEYTGSVTSGFYLGAIKNFVVDNTPYDTMGQFDAGEGSGWMITSNDWFIDKGASEFIVKNGDKIQWKYTCQLGSDIGDNSWERVVGEVEDLIDAIGSPVTLESIDKVTEARTAYDALSNFFQSKVSNYNDLVAAEKVLESLISSGATEEDKAAAVAVDKLIEEIGTVTLESAEKIEAVRKSYENLTSLQKQLVTKLEQLETAENQLKQLNSSSHEEVYKATGNYMASLGTPAVSSIGGEWMVIGLARGNKGLSGSTADGYFNGVLQYMGSVFEQNSKIEQTVRLHENKSTDNSRVILGLTAAGFDATNVNGYNLFKGLDDMDYIRYQGVNGPMWALMALNAHPSYKDELKNVTETDLVNEILSTQLADGGWDLLKTSADADMTGMAIQALAPYYSTDEKVKEAVDKALEKLSSMQMDDGGFASVDGANSESLAQVIVALTSLGINPEEDTRFIKKGMSAVDALCSFAVDGGGFMHTSGTKLDGMATEQGYYALVSYFRLLNGQTSLYDMSDATLKIGKYNENVASAYDEYAADEVEKLIEEIGKVTINSGKRITEAREAYDKLTKAQQKLVENYETLVTAEKEYDELVDEAVDKVMDLIDKIGEVDIDSAEDIAAAKLAYNQLPEELKELVKNYEKLEKAEKELKKLREEALALLAEGKLVLSKTELLELKGDFEKVTEDTGYDAVLALLRTFYKLGESQQLALESSDEVKLAQSIVAKHNHTNAYTGVKADGLEWNIRLAVEETDNETALNDIKAKLENNEILTLWDIYLEDVLTGEKYTLEEAVQLKIPTTLLGDYTLYDYLKVLHYTDDDRIELLNCEVENGYVVFNAAEFSWYGVVGFMNEAEETVGDNLTTDAPVIVNPQVEIPQNSSSPILWIVIAAVGVAALAVLAVMKKRTEDEE